MKYTATSPDDYLSQLPEERAIVISKLRSLIQENIPEGFTEEMSYGMIGYIVPHSLYSEGYHCDPSLPLPFINIASQKNFIAFYHMGMYADKNLYDWFVTEYPKHCSRKLDMGKSCIRFKKKQTIFHMNY
jgi:hypothetical protein